MEDNEFEVEIVIFFAMLIVFYVHFVSFINSLPNPWFWFYSSGFIIVGSLMGGWFCSADEMGYMGGIVSSVGFMAGEVEIGVLMVLVLMLMLVKLFLSSYLICPELNSPLVTMYSLILSLVHSMGSSSCKVLNSNLGTVAFLCFFIYMPLVRSNVQSFWMLYWL